MREEKKGGVGTMPAPGSSCGLFEKKRGKRRRREEGKRLVSYVAKDRLFIRVLLSIHQQLSSPGPLFHPQLPSSPLWVMTGSNWWILLTFSSSSFLTRADLHARVRAPRVPAQVMYITIFPLIRSGSGGALNTVLLCNVTNWADPVRGEDIGNNGV